MNKCANSDCQYEACDCKDNCTCDKDCQCHEGCHCGEMHDDKTCCCHENHAAEKGVHKSGTKCSCSDKQDGSSQCSGKKDKIA